MESLLPQLPYYLPVNVIWMHPISSSRWLEFEFMYFDWIVEVTVVKFSNLLLIELLVEVKQNFTMYLSDISDVPWITYM